jgi:HEPN domain-containing protein
MIIGNNFDRNNVLTYWIESSDNDYKTALDLLRTGNYTWALFMGHLVVEKLLKACYTRTQNEYPPILHDLRRIGEKAGIVFDGDRVIIIETVSQFYIRARYDDYNRNFSKLCTREYAEKWIEQINEIRSWIKTMLSE